MIDNTRLDRTFARDVTRLADAAERIAVALERLAVSQDANGTYATLARTEEPPSPFLGTASP